jgi:uncharacterized protein (TIGR02145 family)
MKKVNLIFATGITSLLFLTACGTNSNDEKKTVDSASETEEKKETDEVTIGKQVWMNKNLNVSKFQNGELIPEANSEEKWRQAKDNKQPAWCYYNFNPDNGDRYGKLYNWYAVNDPRCLAPKGWKIPSMDDWSRLEDFIGSDVGKKLKSKDYWEESDGESGSGTDEFGFNALPGGYYDGYDHYDIGERSSYWTAEISDYTYGGTEEPRIVELSYSSYKLLSEDSDLGYHFTSKSYYGRPVRCIKK